jgi:hypothetical protein
MTCGLVEPGEVLVLRSKMRKACLFLDGDHIAYDVTIGDVVAMRRSDEPLVVLGLAGDGRRHTPPPSLLGWEGGEGREGRERREGSERREGGERGRSDEV